LLPVVLSNIALSYSAISYHIKST